MTSTGRRRCVTTSRHSFLTAEMLPSLAETCVGGRLGLSRILELWSAISPTSSRKIQIQRLIQSAQQCIGGMLLLTVQKTRVQELALGMGHFGVMRPYPVHEEDHTRLRVSSIGFLMGLICTTVISSALLQIQTG